MANSTGLIVNGRYRECKPGKDRDAVIADLRSKGYMVLPVTKAKPSVKSLSKWTFDSVCPATDGCRVEPDGTCQHGHPSWLLALGYI